jgi:hypothetical protein
MVFNLLLMKPPTKILWILFVVGLFFTVLFSTVIFASLMAQLPLGAGLMDIKNAWTKEKMSVIVAIWNQNPSIDSVAIMTTINTWDFVFMFCYGTALFTGLLLVTRALGDRPGLQKWYLLFTIIFPLVAVTTDFIEGIHIAIMLADPQNIQDVNVFGASLSTSICMIFLYTGVIVLVIGFILVLRRVKK